MLLYFNIQFSFQPALHLHYFLSTFSALYKNVGSRKDFSFFQSQVTLLMKIIYFEPILIVVNKVFKQALEALISNCDLLWRDKSQ